MKANLFRNASISGLKLVFVDAIKTFITVTNSIRWISALKAFFTRTKRSYNNRNKDYFFHTTKI